VQQGAGQASAPNLLWSSIGNQITTGCNEDNMLTVRDIMTANVASVRAEDTVYDVADMLSVLAISGAPVRDRAGKFVGVVTQSKLANPRLHSGEREPLVEDVMSAGVLSVLADQPALAAASALVQHDIHRIFVVDDEGRLVGVVSSLDIVRAVARGERFDLDAPDGPERSAASAA
jgi:CBS-domain-containing membrane protein